MKTGIDRLIEEGPDAFAGRVGLVAHAASLTSAGEPSANVLRRLLGDRLAALFGPEHGYAGRAGAGDAVAHERHAEWGIPVHSLYGAHRRPTPEMLKGLDTLVFDLQDVGVRCYTYVSTLREALEACAAANVRVIVADRPIPLPDTVDGPMLDPALRSFVGAVDAPLVYGMTSGETAAWLREAHGLGLDLRISRAEARGFGEEAAWTPPSPALRSRACAQAYPATVWLEAVPALDHARGTPMAFRRVGAPGLDGVGFAERLTARALPGVAWSACAYRTAAGVEVEGVELTVTDSFCWRPARAGVTLAGVLVEALGGSLFDEARGARPRFFDQLFGTTRVREGLVTGVDPEAIADAWTEGLEAFQRTRARWASRRPAADG